MTDSTAPNMADNAVAEACVEKLQVALKRGRAELPLLPKAYHEALRLAQKSDMDYDEVAELAAGDPTLAARLLSVANSAFYTRGVPVTDPKFAAVRLGVQTVRDLLYMAVYSQNMFDAPQFGSVVEESFQHSVVVARLTRMLAKKLGADTEMAFLAGLLHDVGRARCLKMAAKVLRREEMDDVLYACDVLHCEAGAELIEGWKLPRQLYEVCMWHHEPGEHALARLVCLSDMAAHFATPERGVTLELLEETAEPLGVQPDLVQRLPDLAATEQERASGMSSGATG